MYHKGYVEALPVQLPEVTELVREYFKTHYNHNYICRHKKKLVENFIEDLINKNILVYENNLFFSDYKGNIGVYSLNENQIIFKYNFYKKKYNLLQKVE